MLKKYFGLDGDDDGEDAGKDADSQVGLGFQAEEKSCINLNQITNQEGDGKVDEGS